MASCFELIQSRRVHLKRLNIKLKHVTRRGQIASAEADPRVGNPYLYLRLSPPHTLVLKQRDAVSWGCGSDKRIPAETPKGVEETLRKRNKPVNETHAHSRDLTVGLHTPLDTSTVKGRI